MNRVMGEWKTRESYIGNANFSFRGFKSDTTTLLSQGWKIEKITNWWNNHRRLYICHPEFRIIGRGDYWGENCECKLEFMTHEKNIRWVGQNRRKLNLLEDHGINTYVANDIPTLLEIILELQKQELPNLNIQEPTKQADILDFQEVKKLIA